LRRYGTVPTLGLGFEIGAVYDGNGKYPDVIPFPTPSECRVLINPTPFAAIARASPVVPEILRRESVCWCRGYSGIFGYQSAVDTECLTIAVFEVLFEISIKRARLKLIRAVS